MGRQDLAACPILTHRQQQGWGWHSSSPSSMGMGTGTDLLGNAWGQPRGLKWICTLGRSGEPWRAEMGSWATGREVKALQGEQGQAEPAVPHGCNTQDQLGMAEQGSIQMNENHNHCL